MARWTAGLSPDELREAQGLAATWTQGHLLAHAAKP